MWYYILGCLTGFVFYYREEINSKYHQLVKLYNMLDGIETDSLSVYTELKEHGLVKYEYNGETRYIIFTKDVEENALGQRLYVSVEGELYDITPPIGVSFNSSAKQLRVDKIITDIDGVRTEYNNSQEVSFPVSNLDLDL